MRQRIGSAFSNDGSTNVAGPTNLYDAVDIPQAGPFPYVTHTLGSTLLTSVQFPTPSQAWKLISVGVRASLQNGFNLFAMRPFGKLGAIKMGIVLNDDVSPTSISVLSGIGNVPFGVPILPLPTDPSLTELLWTPESNPLPPGAGQPSTLDVNATIFPPVPLDLSPGVPLSVGIWVSPSIVGVNAEPFGGHQPIATIIVHSAAYTITYEDGR